MAKRKEKKLTPARPQLGDNVEILSAGEVLESAITDTLETNYMPYAMSVIVSRALPEIDGFKPAHRKLLYTMYEMGLLKGNRTKSANIVGSTMHLNPHGDAAIYDTMVRLSKGYGALLHPFVDSKGNFGKVYSRDMAWAASRYTEAKLSAICAELFRDIDSDTVDFIDNYDNTMKEPALLPTTFPNILVSANQGIAVGMQAKAEEFNQAGGDFYIPIAPVASDTGDAPGHGRRATEHVGKAQGDVQVPALENPRITERRAHGVGTGGFGTPASAGVVGVVIGRADQRTH